MAASRARSRSNAARWLWNDQLSASTIRLRLRPASVRLVPEDRHVRLRHWRQLVLAAESRGTRSSRADRVVVRHPAPPRSGDGPAAAPCGRGRARRPPSTLGISSKPQPVRLLEGPLETDSRRRLRPDRRGCEPPSVTGIPAIAAVPHRRIPPSWTAIPDLACVRMRCRNFNRARDEGRINPHSAAALRWLSNALFPQASTAAIHRPRELTPSDAECVNACDAGNEGDLLRLDVRSLEGQARDEQLRREITPCWRSASARQRSLALCSTPAACPLLDVPGT